MTIQIKAIEQYFQVVLFLVTILPNEIQIFSPSVLNIALLGVKGLRLIFLKIYILYFP